MRKKRAKKTNIYYFLRSLIGGIVFLLLLGLVLTVRQSAFGGESGFSWLFTGRTGEVMVVGMPGGGLPGVILRLPADLELECARSLGKYPVKNIYELGEQQKIGGGQLLKESIQQNLFIPIDKYVYWGKELGLGDEGQVKRAIVKTVMRSLLPGKCQTNLSYGDKLKLLWFFLQQDLAAWEYSDLTGYVLPTGEQTITDVSSALGEKLIYGFVDNDGFSATNKTIGVLNIGQCSGAASKTVFLINNMGSHAVIVKDGEEQFVGSQLLVREQSDLKQPYLKRLVALLGLTNIKVAQFSDRVDWMVVLDSGYCRLE